MIYRNQIIYYTKSNLMSQTTNKTSKISHCVAVDDSFLDESCAELPLATRVEFCRLHIFRALLRIDR